jgi:hypothetical protein
MTRTVLLALLLACGHGTWAADASDNEARRLQYELTQKCARDAREWFNQNYPNTDNANAVYDYSNHYSAAKNRCYALLHSLTVFQKSKKFKGETVQSNELYDVNENSRIGAYIIADFSRVTACEFGGAKCRTADEWKTLARPYLVD